MIFSLISPPSFLKFTFFPGMTVIKKQVFRFLRWFNRPMRDEILSFRKDYEQLVGRYEALLKQISKYMKDHSFILNEEYKNSDDVWKQLNSVDSFMLQTIRGDLELITRDCEYLLEKRSRIQLISLIRRNCSLFTSPNSRNFGVIPTRSTTLSKISKSV